MISGKHRRTSVLLREKQIDFLRNLARKIEKESHEKMSRCKIIEVFTRTLTHIKPEIGECRNETEIENVPLKCLKKPVKKPKA